MTTLRPGSVSSMTVTATLSPSPTAYACRLKDTTTGWCGTRAVKYSLRSLETDCVAGLDPVNVLGRDRHGGVGVAGVGGAGVVHVNAENPRRRPPWGCA